jgi:hypothetical protein
MLASHPDLKTEGLLYTHRKDAFLNTPNAPIEEVTLGYMRNIYNFGHLLDFRSIMAWSRDPNVLYLSSFHEASQIPKILGGYPVRFEESGIFFPASVGTPSPNKNLTKFVPVHWAISRSERNYYDLRFGTITGYLRSKGLYYPFTTAHNSSPMPIRVKNFSSNVYYPPTPYRDDDLDFHGFADYIICMTFVGGQMKK